MSEPPGEDWVSPDLPIPEIQPITPGLVVEMARERQERQKPNTALNTVEGIDYEYRVGVRDVLNVVVWDHPELSRPMGETMSAELQGQLVRADGTIFFPFVGVIEVAGKTVEEIRHEITEGLQPFIEDPQVDVRVVSFRSRRVYLTGQVREPGIMAIDDDPLTALDAINRAGGFTALADRQQALLTRDGERRTIDLAALYASGRGDLVLRDRDILHVPDNSFNKVFVMGETLAQRSVPMPGRRLTLAEAISEAEGFDLQTANTTQVYVIRGELVLDDAGQPIDVRPEVFHLDTRDAASLVLAEGFELQSRDVVFVSATPVVRFNRVIQQILPTIQTIFFTRSIIGG